MRVFTQLLRRGQEQRGAGSKIQWGRQRMSSVVVPKKILVLWKINQLLMQLLESECDHLLLHGHIITFMFLSEMLDGRLCTHFLPQRVQRKQSAAQTRGNQSETGGGCFTVNAVIVSASASHQPDVWHTQQLSVGAALQSWAGWGPGVNRPSASCCLLYGPGGLMIAPRLLLNRQQKEWQLLTPFYLYASCATQLELEQ